MSHGSRPQARSGCLDDRDEIEIVQGRPGVLMSVGDRTADSPYDRMLAISPQTRGRYAAGGEIELDGR